MELEFDRIETPAGIAVEVDGQRWQVGNTRSEPMPVRAVSRVFRVRHHGSLRMFSHGHQSWSWSGLAVHGEDVDPSSIEGSLALLRGMHHADEAPARHGDLRSELVTALADDDGAVVLGADGGDRHDTTFWLRSTDEGHVELWVEAFLGGAEIPAGAWSALHDVLTDDGDDPTAGLAWWATSVGRRHHARTSAPYQIGWCSWYQYFHGVTEDHVRANLARAGDWPFEVFQIDDGFQPAIGDWLTTNEKFPSPLETLAADIAEAGLLPGIWLAPFLAAPDSDVARDHPDWIAERGPGRSLIGMINDGWGGIVHTLDTTHPDVLEHLESTAGELVRRGFRYLKLDFTYAPSMRGVYHDPTLTPAQRVRAGYDAIRRGAGDDTFILGCGAPLGPCIGAVDGMRIGADVAPWWDVSEAGGGIPGYERTQPATANALQNTISRAFMHRRLWLNDPDCLMLRTDDTRLTAAAVDAWAHAVAMSGGMALVSDDLALLDADARSRLADAVDLGRRVDDASLDGAAPVGEDVMDAHRAGRLAAAGRSLRVDPTSGAFTLEP